MLLSPALCVKGHWELSCFETKTCFHCRNWNIVPLCSHYPPESSWSEVSTFSCSPGTGWILQNWTLLIVQILCSTLLTWTRQVFNTSVCHLFTSPLPYCAEKMQITLCVRVLVTLGGVAAHCAVVQGTGVHVWFPVCCLNVLRLRPRSGGEYMVAALHALAAKPAACVVTASAHSYSNVRGIFEVNCQISES